MFKRVFALSVCVALLLCSCGKLNVSSSSSVPSDESQSLASQSSSSISSKSADSAVYLDIDNDGIQEKTEYLQDQNVLQITKNGQLFIQSNLYDYGVTFNGIGMHNALYFYEYVRDAESKVYLHFHTSALITDVSPDFKTYFSVREDYYDLVNSQWNLVDSASYVAVWDRLTTAPAQKTNITINGQPADSLESLQAKYTAIPGTYYEIPYD